MLCLHPSRLRTILCIGAHADDIEIGCGGTLLTLLDRVPGLEVHWAVFSAQGQRGEEARHSAAAFLQLAADQHLTLLGFRDSYFPYQGADIKEAMERLRTRVLPDLVFTHRVDDAHQDHRLLGELTWCAFRNQLILEYEVPKYEGDLGRPNCYVAVDKSTCQRKIDLLTHSFPSQHQKPWFREDTFWATLRLRGIEAGGAAEFAEAYIARKFQLG